MTQHLGQALRHEHGPARPSRGTAPEGDDSDALSPGALGPLFDSSPARPVQTSAAAPIAFLLGLSGVLAVPFARGVAISPAMAAVALVSSIIGMARASRPAVAGGLL